MPSAHALWHTRRLAPDTDAGLWSRIPGARPLAHLRAGGLAVYVTKCPGSPPGGFAMEPRLGVLLGPWTAGGPDALALLLEEARVRNLGRPFRVTVPGPGPLAPPSSGPGVPVGLR